jgi:hypothetical protein
LEFPSFLDLVVVVVVVVEAATRLIGVSRRSINRLLKNAT